MRHLHAAAIGLLSVIAASGAARADECASVPPVDPGPAAPETIRVVSASTSSSVPGALNTLTISFRVGRELGPVTGGYGGNYFQFVLPDTFALDEYNELSDASVSVEGGYRARMTYGLGIGGIVNGEIHGVTIIDFIDVVPANTVITLTLHDIRNPATAGDATVFMEHVYPYPVVAASPRVLLTFGPAAPSDSDGDGVCDGKDNCAAAANPDQADVDLDGIGDVCDPHFDSEHLSELVAETSASARGALEGLAAFPGRNGLLAKLFDISGAILESSEQHELGSLTGAAYAVALVEILDTVGAFENQLAARTAAVGPSASATLLAAAAELRAWIGVLLAHASAP